MRKSMIASLVNVSIILIFLFLVLTPITSFAWGDSNGGRESHSIQEINENNPFGNTPVFNTITVADTDYEWHKNYFGTEIPKTTITHEKNFVGARKDNGTNDAQTNVWDGNQIEAEDGQTYVIRLYAHNNNPNGEQAVSENTKVSFVGLNDKSTLQEVDVVDETGKATGEKVMKQQIEVNGKITSSNANPQRYWDYVNFQSDVPFHLEYVYGSALLENNGFASVNNIYNVPGGGNGPVKLSDDIVDNADGTLIGFYGLDGRVPGCYKYAEYVTIRVKVVYDYDFTVEQKVRLANNENADWEDVVTVESGDLVEFRIEYKNTSDAIQNNVTLKDFLPENLNYIENTARINEGEHSDNREIVQKPIRENSIQLGDYDAGTNAYVYFTVEVTDKNLTEGANTISNWAQISIGSTMVQDYSAVVLYKNAVWFDLTVKILSCLIVVCFVLIVILLLCKFYPKHRK